MVDSFLHLSYGARSWVSSPVSRLITHTLPSGSIPAQIVTPLMRTRRLLIESPTMAVKSSYWEPPGNAKHEAYTEVPGSKSQIWYSETGIGSSTKVWT